MLNSGLPIKRYFKHVAESDLGEGVVFLEIADGWPTRQVEEYGTVWRWADEAHPAGLADQPFDELELTQEHEIDAGEFEAAWREALSRCPRPS